MKKIVLVFLIAITGVFASAQYKAVEKGSEVKFKVKNFGFNVGGSFSGLEGTIQFDPNNLAASSFDVSIDANTIFTDNNARDNHLREESYFDVKNYPRIRFVSTRVTTSNKKGVLFIFGKLTIKKETKEISFPFTADPVDDGYLFKGGFKINRRDYGVGGSSTISDNVELNLSVLAKK
ncbi:MAG: YceI family protein [Bacteroidetes bacterium]|nr:YceI family protein [Bacteroidota bacterium]